MSLIVNYRDSDEYPVTIELVPSGIDGFDCDFCGIHSDVMIAAQFTQKWLGDPADGHDMVEIGCVSHITDADGEIREVKINN